MLDHGPDPKTHSGELSILYFDASRVFAGFAAAPDHHDLRIQRARCKHVLVRWQRGRHSRWWRPHRGQLRGASFIDSSTAADTTIGGQSYRHLGFDIDVSSIVSHAPEFPVAGTDWYGDGFDTSLGIWFHPAQTFDLTYEPPGAGNRGAITSFDSELDGFVDGANFQTSIIPAPGGAGAIALSGVLLATRAAGG